MTTADFNLQKTPEKFRQRSKPKTIMEPEKSMELEDHEEENEMKKVQIEKDAIKKSKKAIKKKKVLSIPTIDLYDAPLTWWEEPRVRYAINYPPVKARLNKLMGSHTVRLTDRKYMLRLMSKIQEYHEEQQRIRIEERKLTPPSIISRLLLISYSVLSEKIRRENRNKE